MVSSLGGDLITQLHVQKMYFTVILNWVKNNTSKLSISKRSRNMVQSGEEKVVTIDMSHWKALCVDV